MLSKYTIFYLKLWLKKLSMGIKKKQVSIAERRKKMLEMSQRFKSGNIPAERVAANGIPCVMFNDTEAQSKSPIMLYLHGGGYVMGSIATHQSLCKRIAETCNLSVLAVEYRLAPEYPFPAAPDDAISAYLWLVKRYPDRKVIVAGDSAGGGLALALTIKLIEDREQTPDMLVLFAPWTDLSCSTPKVKEMAKSDLILDIDELHEAAKVYSGRFEIENPFISPINASFKSFPPVYIQVGGKDMLMEDSLRVVEKMKADGVEVELDIWEKMFHVWQSYSMIPQAKEALQAVNSQISKTLNLP
ncbi:MAG: hypothetical protein CMO01_11970 [Thalassobius sp.]|nr:hypothetical protein [Thalassovita sp.]